MVSTIAFLFCLLWPAALHAQSYLIRTYTEADGLASSTVYDIARGHEGLLWFATRSGICSYDGALWRRVELEEGLPATSFLRVEVARDGTVWAFNNTHIQVYFRRQGQWISLPPFGNARWNWYTASELALLEHGGATRPAVASRLGLFVWGGERWHHHAVGPVLSLESMGDRLIFGVEQGLFELDAPGGEPRPLAVNGPVIDRPVLGLAATPGPQANEPRDLWVYRASASGEGQFEVGRLERRPDGGWTYGVVFPGAPRLSDQPGEIRLAPDRRGDVFVADRRQLLHLAADGTLERFSLQSGFIAPGATGLELGEDGVLWTTSERGVSKLISRRFASYQKADGLLESEVSAILELEPGAMLLGHDGGLSEMRGGRVVTTWAIPPTDEGRTGQRRVMDLLRVGADVWAVTPSKIWRLPDAELAAVEPLADGGVEPPSQLASAALDPEGRPWVAGEGLMVFEDGAFQPMESPAPWGQVRRLHTAGDLYAATVSQGLWRLRGGAWSRLMRADGTSPSLYTVMDWRSEIWVGADEGLFRLVGGQLVKARQPAIDRPVYALREDAEGTLWVGTDLGLVRWDGRRARRLGRHQGLAGHEINRDGLVVDHRGHLWIGTALGLSRYVPALDARPTPPVPVLDGVEVGGELESLRSPLDIAWNRNQLSFRFRARTFIDEERLQFSGRLVGFDDEFQPPSRALGRRMHYTNLPSGDYRFEIRARHGPEGAWGPTVRSPLLRVGRPFWRSPVFFAGLLLGLVLVVGAGVHFRATRRHGRRLEQLVDDRTRELTATNRRLTAEVDGHRRTEERLRSAKSEAEAASRAKSRFLAVMSHEIRTPMAGVLGTVELLERGELAGRQRERVLNLRRSGQALLTLLDDLLDYSRSEAGRLELYGEPFEPRTIVDDVVALFGSMAAEKGVALRSAVAQGVPTWLEGDVSRVRQVLVNLTGNALKFTAQGGVDLRADWSAQGLEITVSDTGIGIPESDRERLFEPFQQVDLSAGRRFGGTGLGLAICRQLVSAMGGEIRLESEVGEGSKFTVLFPLPATAAPPPSAVGSQDTAADALGLSVLLAEDNLLVQQLTVEMLELLGCRVAVAADGVEVLDALEGQHFDLVLMDVQMPVLDGLGATRQVRQRWPERELPIVALTAHALRGDRDLCLAAGMDDYLSKPLTLLALETKLKEWSIRH
ncbi:MAG: ATP-binding protein [Acidobacteriota bacterium]